MLRHRKIGQRAHRRELHRFVHRRRADIERAAKDERKAQHVVDLVRKVGTSRRDDGVGPRRFRDVRHDFGLGICEGHDQRLVGHFRQPLRLQYLRGGKPEENVGARKHVDELSRVGLLRVAGLVVVHLLLAAGVDDARDVGHPDVLPWNPERNEQIEAGERRRAGARTDELDLGDVLADHAQSVGDRRADDDRRAVLVVVEHRDLHPLAELLLHVEALGRLDVLEVDPAERRLERGDDLDQPGRIALVDFDVEAVDAGELLEQHCLAFHHRLRGERTDRAEAEHRGSVGDDADQVAARGEVARLGSVADDFVARGCNARRVGKTEVVLCAMTRIKICINNIKNPFDDCELDPNKPIQMP